MNQGLRYPDACNQALSILMNKNCYYPLNDLLGLAYVKEVINHNYPIELHCIKRTNDFHSLDIESISSASAIRHALKNKLIYQISFVTMKTIKNFTFLMTFIPSFVIKF